MQFAVMPGAEESQFANDVNAVVGRVFEDKLYKF
jgi:hypothetical protein